MVLTYDTADRVVEGASRKDRDVFWDGWTICVFRPKRNAWKNQHGQFRKGRWGFVSRIPVCPDGTWSVPDDFVK